jgi:hypothetical protein
LFANQSKTIRYRIGVDPLNTKYVAHSKVELRLVKGIRHLTGLTLLIILFLSLAVPSVLAVRQDSAAPGAAAELNALAVEGIVIGPAQSGSCDANPANVLANGSFEGGDAGWSFFSNANGRLDVGSPATDCSNAAHVTLTKVGSNMQLYQDSFTLKADTRYRLSFSAFSSAGNDMRVYVQQHDKPYAAIGLKGQVFNLTSEWQQFSTEFTTTGFSGGTTTDTRLRFWPVRYAANGDVYHFDNVVLEEVGGANPPASPTNTPAPANPTNTPVPSGPTATPPPQSGSGSCTAVDTLLNNADFESGTSSWSFFSNGSGSFNASSPAYQCDKAANLTLTRMGSNVQLYQSGFPLRANGRYRLTFAAYSSSGNDMRLYVQRHGSPYAAFGLSGETVNLTTSWQTYTVEFTASGFSGTTTDTRLRFWFPGKAANGDIYHIDAVALQEIGGGSPPTSTATPPPNATATPRPSATPPPSSGGGGGRNEMVVFDWNGPVTEANRGFPNNTPPRANGDWTKPINFAQGTLEYRLEIRSQPQPQDMRIQLCFWQTRNGNKFGLESCGPQQAIRGNPGTVKTWSVNVQDMWKLGGRSIEWDRPRFRAGAAIKNAKSRPVSNYNGWNWNGENPKQWYPLNMRFTVVVVAKGSTFSGWDNYK